MSIFSLTFFTPWQRQQVLFRLTNSIADNDVLYNDIETTKISTQEEKIRLPREKEYESKSRSK